MNRIGCRRRVLRGALAALALFGSVLAGPSQSARDTAMALIRDARVAATRERPARALPIGVFDSGTGGLAVLEQVLRLDCFDNETHAPKPEGDGRPDFEDEQFLFLADQANMPYGNYPALGRRSCLVDLALNDAVFLMGSPYHASAAARTAAQDKLPVKSIIIACNTATAYAKEEIEALIREAGVEVTVVGIIEGGALGVMESLAGTNGATIGVLATRGTCESGAYPSAIQALARQRGKPAITVVQQGSRGLAGAIDGVRDFIQPEVASTKTRSDYRGPSLTNAQDRLEAALLPRYHFDFSGHHMLWEGEPARPTALQINSVDNYIAYETVCLLEQLRRAPPRQPMSAIVLGCTHFPYFAAAFDAQLRRLRDYQEDGRYVYRSLMAENIRLIDPAVLAAQQLYTTLAAHQALNRPAKPALAGARGRFFITVPNPQVPARALDASGAFTFDYKYGRAAMLGATDYLTVPLTPASFPPEVPARLQRQLPAVWRLLEGPAQRSQSP